MWKTLIFKKICNGSIWLNIVECSLAFSTAYKYVPWLFMAWLHINTRPFNYHISFARLDTLATTITIRLGTSKLQSTSRCKSTASPLPTFTVLFPWPLLWTQIEILQVWKLTNMSSLFPRPIPKKHFESSIGPSRPSCPVPRRPFLTQYIELHEVYVEGLKAKMKWCATHVSID